jgi:histidinol-phosphate/aromatic aminotransferase/cobyric acid decarboxylase-like protein/choline kinase
VKALILAAGLGRRLGELTRDRTKAMVEVGRRMLIHRALDALRDAGIKDVVVVIGHGGAALRAALQDYPEQVRITFVENPAYETTNNIYSLWLARETLASDDTLILESDLIFDPRLIEDVLADRSENLAVVSPFKPGMDGTVTLVDDDDVILSVVPRTAFDWRESSRYFKTVNVYRFSKAFSRNLYLPFLEAYIHSFGRNRFYEQVLAVIATMGRGELRAHRTTRAWYEIDDVEDLRNAETLFAAPEHKGASYARRHGGYWRFPNLLDACYLVHPFYPPERLVQEMQAQFATLLGAYPSGADIQRELISRLFPVRASQVLAGNGASEIIRSLRRVLKGPWSVPVPTFEEYLAHGTDDIRFETAAANFEFDPRRLERRARGAQVLALVNPNNPSGRLMSASEVDAALDMTRDLGMRLIVDESFLDFAVDGGTRSLLDASTLAANRHVIVVRSLGKSHGVAGLRLGFVASGDWELLAALRADLPIWNIGSLAEAFLQAAPRHHEAYVESCRRLAAERSRLQAKLVAIPGLRAFPSQANFLLCELDVDATPVVNALIERFNILIKDCTGKAGIPSPGFIRIAVRTEEENDRLALALRKVLPG